MTFSSYKQFKEFVIADATRYLGTLRNNCVAGVPAQIISMDGAEGYVNNRV